jgi:thiamine-phosphate pyrophosphorylase
MTEPSCQLYLISPAEIGDDFADNLRIALETAPVAAFQLRLKGTSEDQIIAAAQALQPICSEHDCAFILNDRADIAGQLAADGVHLGQADGSITEARALLGPTVQIGSTCHDSRHLAMAAGEAGADYVAFGAFFPSETKATTHRPEPEILTWWSSLFELPCVAIGGITAANAGPLIAAGADFIAVSSAVWSHPEGVAAGVQEFADLLEL